MIVLVLYQFPISHYCEKARWALEYKGLEYKKVNLLPGFHIKKAKKLASKPSLPILVHDGKAINESRNIISYLDQAFPNKLLTPEDENLKQAVVKWEQLADQEIGADVRCLCYHTLLDHPDITIPFFTVNGPWYGNLLMKFTYPKLSIKMRELMQLNDKTVELINQRLTKVIDKIHEHISNREFFVGDTFTRADIAVASLLAPLVRPKNYGLAWPEQYPEPLHSTVAKFGNKLNWVTRIYNQYR